MKNQKSTMTTQALLVTTLLSAFLSWFLVHFEFFPIFAIACIFWSLSMLVLLGKEKRSRLDYFYFFSTSVLSFFLIYRANILLSFINIWTIIYVGGLWMSQDSTVLSLVGTILAPVMAFVRVLAVPFSPGHTVFPIQKEHTTKDHEKSYTWLISVFAAAAVVIVITPFLVSANPLFARFIDWLLKTINILRYLPKIDNEFIAVNSFRVVLFIIFAAMLPRVFLLGSVNNDEKENSDEHQGVLPFSLVLAKAAAACILIVFFVTQAALYFSSPATLIAMGLTQSQYAREVFGQLIIVATIILFLLYADRQKNTRSRMLTWVLIFQVLFLIVMAVKSDVDYTLLHGFTEKRLWGYALTIWLIGVFILYAKAYLRDLKYARILFPTVVMSVCLLITIHVINFDMLIANVLPPTVNNQIDERYISEHSRDSGSRRRLTLALYNDLANSQVKGVTPADLGEKGWALWQHLDVISYLKNKYGQKRFPYWAFHIAEYMEYLSIKDLNDEQMRSFIESHNLLPAQPVELIQINEQ
ncbi:DUF4173 domain-containing protein [Candidatus Gottesmanbacteria bacterium]|nr:DUF4173 domain-containing protein [Candidatus Gottesmanbacteria bacterium]